jgi:hypothetical protein
MNETSLNQICELEFQACYRDTGLPKCDKRYLPAIKLIYSTLFTILDKWFHGYEIHAVCDDRVISLNLNADSTKDTREVDMKTFMRSNTMLFMYDHYLYEATFHNNQTFENRLFYLNKILPQPRYKELPMILRDSTDKYESLTLSGIYWTFDDSCILEIGKFVSAPTRKMSRADFSRFIMKAHMIDRTIKQVLIEFASTEKGNSIISRCKTNTLYEPRLIPLVFSYLTHSTD